MGAIIIVGFIILMGLLIWFDLLGPAVPYVGPSTPSMPVSSTHVDPQSTLFDRPPKSAERTTTQLIGSGLVYFVFWFFGAPMLFLFLFLVSASAGVLEIFLIAIVLGIVGFICHTVWIIADGLEASASVDKAAEPSKLVNAPSGQSDRIPCPMCAELILPEAKICRFCKSEIRKD